VKYEGYNGQIDVGDELVITRDGAKARMIFGKGVSARRIPLPALSGVQLREATRMTNGWVQLSFGGETPREVRKGSAASDANTVTFTHRQRDRFQERYEELESILAKNAAAGIDPTQVKWDRISGEQGRLGKRASPEWAAQQVEERQAKAEAAGLRPDIAAASARMNWTFGGKREIKKLEEHLYEGEVVQYLAQGEYEGKQGLLALTDQRLCFVFHGLLSQAVEDFPFDRLTSVQTKAGIGTGDLTVYASGNSSVIKSIIKTDLKYLADALRQRIGEGNLATQRAAPPASPTGPVGVADQLTKLADLRDRGVLTDDEFAAQKAKLLGA
jgi:hypothetical protein